MTVITKAALAAELAVSKSRVSQYVNAGLPVRSDGKLDRETALDWIGANLRSSPDHRKGPARARTLQPQPARPTPTLDNAEAARRAIAAVLADVVFSVMSVASDLDLPVKVIFALAMNLRETLADIEGEHLKFYRWGVLPPRAPEELSVDWASVAEGQGEPFDMPAWEAYRAEMQAKAWGETDPSASTPEQ